MTVWPLLPIYLVIGILAYAIAMGAGFVSDDWDFLGLVSRAPSILICFSPLVGRFFRPWVVLTYYVNYSLFGLWTLPYHLSVVLLHVLNAWLVAKLAAHLDTSQRPVVPLAAGLLFLLCASHSEAVTWVAGVADPAVTLFVLGSLLWFVRALMSERPLAPMILAWLLFVAGMLAKETAAVLPALAIVFAALNAAHLPDRRQALKRTAVFVSVPIMLTAAYLVARTSMFGTAFGAYGELGTSRGIFVQQACAFFVRTFLPPLSIATAIWVRQPYLLVLCLASAMVVVFAAAQRVDRRAIAFALAGTLIALLPALPLTISMSSTESERYVYLATAFSSILVAISTASVVRVQPLVAVVLTAFIALHAVYLQRANRTWREAGLLCDRLMRTFVETVRSHESSRRSQVFILNLPDNLRGAYVFRNGFYPMLELLAPDLGPGADYIRGVATHSMSTPDDPVNVFERDGLTFVLDIHPSRFVQTAPPTTFFYKFPRWDAGQYELRFTESMTKGAVMAMNRGRIAYVGEVSGPGLPFGNIDVPADNASCEGTAIRFAGWALDDESIQRVVVAAEISRDSGEKQLAELASAVTGASRPDVAAVFPSFPGRDRAGWDYWLPCEDVRNQPDREIVVQVIAHDNRGHENVLGTRRVKAR